MSKFLDLELYSDGGSRGNPGPAGAGGIVLNHASKAVLAEVSVYLGEMTNNQAEYRACIMTLEKALALKPQTLICYLDSELIVKQLNGQYKVRHAELKPHFEQMKKLCRGLSVRFVHIRREKNTVADLLVNQAIDKALGIL